MSKLQEIKNIITANRPLEKVKIDFENDEGAGISSCNTQGNLRE